MYKQMEMLEDEITELYLDTGLHEFSISFESCCFSLNTILTYMFPYLGLDSEVTDLLTGN